MLVFRVAGFCRSAILTNLQGKLAIFSVDRLYRGSSIPKLRALASLEHEEIGCVADP